MKFLLLLLHLHVLIWKLSFRTKLIIDWSVSATFCMGWSQWKSI